MFYTSMVGDLDHKTALEVETLGEIVIPLPEKVPNCWGVPLQQLGSQKERG